MSPRLIAVEVIAVLAGAVIGLLVVDFFMWLFANAAFFATLASIGQLVVALATVSLFAVYYRFMPPTPAALASFFTGVLLPTVLVGFGFDSVLSWGSLAFLYAIFSVVALLTYRFVHANGAVRHVAGRAVDDV